jgi:Xaa-Pro dipeptidase
MQTRLRADGLAGGLLFDPENIYYLTWFQSIGYFTYQTLVLPSAGRPTLISRKVNPYLARATRSLGACAPAGRADAPPPRHDLPRRAHGVRRGDRRVP